MISLFNEFKKSQELIEIYSDKENSNKFIVGKVIGVTESEVLLQLVDPNGQFDGYLAMYQSSIYKICEKTAYLKTISLLYDGDDNLSANNEEDLMVFLAKFAFDKEDIITVEIKFSGLEDSIGLIKEINNQYMVIEAISEEGKSVGKEYIAFSAMTEISCLSKENCQLKALYLSALK